MMSLQTVGDNGPSPPHQVITIIKPDQACGGLWVLQMFPVISNLPAVTLLRCEVLAGVSALGTRVFPLK